MTFIITAIFFIFGTIIGSFLNVVIYRFNTKTFGGRSACMSCSKQLAWYDLVPVLSFVFLGARCRNCKTRISFQYPLVEFASGIVFALLFSKFQLLFWTDSIGFTTNMAYYATMFSILLVITIYDLKHKIIPDKLSLIFGTLAFIGLFFFDPTGSFIGFYPHIPSMWAILSGLIISVPFALIWLISKGTWMGLGDAKLAVGLGLLLGVEKLLSGVILAFWSGALIGIVLLIFSKKYNRKSEIPFAPFLVLGSILAFFLTIHFFPVFSGGF